MKDSVVGSLSALLSRFSDVFSCGGDVCVKINQFLLHFNKQTLRAAQPPIDT
jgi:hypothetical protein